MNVEHPSVVRLEKIGWGVVKVAFVALVLMLILNPATKGRAGFSSTGLETVLPARIKAAGLFSINAELSGTITELAVKAGDTVTGDQLLAVISNPAIEGLVERAHRRMSLAAERLKQPKTSAQPQHRWLDEQRTAAAKNVQAAERRVREFTLADAEQSFARARANSARIKSLLDQHLATAREADNELRNLNARRELGTRLRQELESAHSQLKMAQLQLDSVNPVAAPDSGYAKLEFKEAKAAYESLNERLSGLRIVARHSGTVIRVNATPGSAVQEGATLFEIANSGNLHFDVSAPATIARSVHPGDRVLVRVPTDPPSEVPARVAKVLLEPDPQQLSYLIRVTIPNPAPDRFLVGLEGAVSFTH